MTQSSISFDHAADFYDATRALPTEVHEALTDALIREIESVSAERVLEIGVGTGRIARPLAERGVRVCGVDIAPRMLARLREQLTPGHLPPDLLLGDATRLPLADGSFPAIVICHILHLVSDREAAVAEMRRVLAPGGVVLHHTEEDMEVEDFDAFVALLDRLLKERGFVRRPRLRSRDSDAALACAGASCRTETLAEWQERWTPGRLLDRVRRRIDSWTWEIPEDLLSDSLDAVEPWARRRFGDLDAERIRRTAYRLQVWSFP